MALDTPESPAIIERDMKTDFQRELVSSNPFLPNSWTSALISGFSNRLFDNFITLDQAVDESFYDTSSEVFLERQADWYGLTRFGATQATGLVIATGTLGTLIPEGTEFASSDGIKCLSNADVSIISIAEAATTLTSIGTTATFTFTETHQLSTGVTVAISGATPNDYNGIFTEINVIDDKSFEYEMLSDPGVDATGAVLIDYNSALIDCTTVDFSSEANLSGSSKVIVSAAISGVDSDAFVYIDGFSGGSDQEDIEAFRARFLERVGNPVAQFNKAAITTKAREVSGVTRVFVYEVIPDVGQVTVFFTRDNDEDIIPDVDEAKEVKDKILEILPANTSKDDLFVNPLVGVPTSFTITVIDPSTDTMRNAIKNSLDEFFRTTPEPNINVTSTQYLTAIQNTIDLNTGERLKTFTLTSPTTDIFITTGQIATLGSVSV